MFVLVCLNVCLCVCLCFDVVLFDFYQGSYQDQASSTRCLFCSTGSYSNGTRVSACATCPVSTYSSVAGSSACLACRFGEFSSIGGASICGVCAAGAITLDRVTCTTCEAGSFADRNLQLCTLCTAVLPGVAK
jgi:hypothetical protein